MSDKNEDLKYNKIAAIPLRGVIPFPNSVFTFDVGREYSVNAVKNSFKNQEYVFLVSQKDILNATPSKKDIYNIGVLAKVKQVVKINEYVYRVLVETYNKASVLNYSYSKKLNLINVEVQKIEDDIHFYEDVEVQAHIRNLKSIFSLYEPDESFSSDFSVKILNANDPYYIVNSIATNLYFDVEDKQKLLEMESILNAMDFLSSILLKEIEIINIEKEINKTVKKQIGGNQREYFLRQQLKTIKEELGEDIYEDENKTQEYMDMLNKLQVDNDTYEKLKKEILKFDKLMPNTQESNVSSLYLDICLSLPFKVKSKDNKNLKNASKILEKEHFALDKVKDRILEFVAVNNLTENKSPTIICLSGPPGVGKTSVAMSVANALKKKFVRVSLGGISDEAEIRGHRRTYIGSMPGKIIKAIQKAKVCNPVILLDEIDKMGSNMKGDPASALLEVLDIEQNKNFEDHYLEVPFDLSNVMFIATANNPSNIPLPLKDRMEIIYLDSYTREEKFNIAKRYLIKKQIEKNGLNKNNIKINDSVIYDIIDFYVKEAGVRELERQISKICRKLAKEIVFEKKDDINVNSKNLYLYLGPRKYTKQGLVIENKIGVCNGLAWTSVGGELLPIEVNILNGSGKIQMTGHLGDVMKESIQIAISYIRSMSKEFGIYEDFYKTKDIHIHFTEGAVPKDGPSAGVAIATSVLSALTDKYIYGNVAMTGEISLRGNVHKIGGLKEKAMGAYKENIKKIIIPYDNLADIYEIDDVVKNSIEFIPVRHFSEIVKEAIVNDDIIKNFKNKDYALNC